jgi:hypothetical protein
MLSGLVLFTLVHVAFSLVGIVTGVPFAYEILTSREPGWWAWVFITSTIMTSVTGFGFPANQVTPAHPFGVISLIALGIAIYALYTRKLQGKWLYAYIANAIVAFYLNAFVLVVQLFLKVPVLKAIAPTQTEPAFVIAQLVLLIGFVLLAFYSLRRYRPVFESTDPIASESPLSSAPTTQNSNELSFDRD